MRGGSYLGFSYSRGSGERGDLSGGQIICYGYFRERWGGGEDGGGLYSMC